MESSSSSYRRITAIYQSRIGSSSKGSSSEKVSRSFSLFNLNGGSSGGVWEEGGDERSSEPPAVLEVVQECVDIMKEHVDVLDKLSKSFAPVLFNKLKEEQLAVVLFRLSSNHRSLFEKIVPSSDATETMDNAVSKSILNSFFYIVLNFAEDRVNCRIGFSRI